jgi:predicted acetyltransferase
MAFLHSLADQVHLVIMDEPPGIALQDFIQRPLRSRSITQKSKYETGITAMTYQQARIVNLPAAIDVMRTIGPSIEFNLVIKDPVTRFLPPDAPWAGCAGSYTIRIGETSAISDGHTDGLDTLTADIGAFSRFWLGSRTATALAVTADFHGPDSLLNTLDRCNCLPIPSFDWNF